MYSTVNTSQLATHKGAYEFTIKQDDEGIFITIPGYGGGRDGPTTPYKPEQQEWMREKSGFKEVWYLMWQCKSEKSLNKFIAKLENQ